MNPYDSASFILKEAIEKLQALKMNGKHKSELMYHLARARVHMLPSLRKEAEEKIAKEEAEMKAFEGVKI